MLQKAEIYQRLPVFKRQILRARHYIAEFLGQCTKPYLSFSAGKDSSVAAYMANALCPGIPMLHVRTDIDFPENKETLLAIQNKFHFNITVIESEVSAWELLQQESGNIFSQVNMASSKLDRVCFYEPINQFVMENKFDGVVMGLRAQESRGRLNNLKYNGAIYKKKDGMLVCNPISHFGDLDVFAYLSCHEIPISPIYNKTGLGTPPGRLREGWWPPGESTSKHGYCIWLKYYYPDLFNKLVEAFPEVKQFV